MNGHRLPPSPSHTATVLHELQLHGYRPGSDEPDPRPLPDARHLVGAIDDLFDALAGSLQETRIEPDLEDLLWSLVNIFHRSALRTGDELDTNPFLRAGNPETQAQIGMAGADPARVFAEIRKRKDNF